MSEMFSRRLFLKGLGTVAAAAALTACSSTNEAVNQALTKGSIGGLVATDCNISRSTFQAVNSDIPVPQVRTRITLTNVSSSPVTFDRDNFVTTLDGAPIAMQRFTVLDVGSDNIWRLRDNLTLEPGEERRISLSYEINQPTYDSWYSSSHTVAVTFTCGGQRVTYTKNSRSDDVIASEIETL